MEKSELKQRTARGLMWGGIGSGGVQLLNLLFGIFLSRLLSPGDYGVVGALTIFAATAGLLAESGFTFAIANKRTVTDRDYNSVFWFNIAVGAACYALLFALAPSIARFYHQPEMTWLARFLFFGFMAGATAAAPSAWFFRNLQVKVRTQAQIAAIVVSGSVGVACAWCGWGYWGLAMQTVLYASTNSVILWMRSPWHPSLTFSMAPIREMLPFSSKQLLTSLFTHINNNFFSMLLGRVYTMRITGFYSQGAKWTTMGTNTISGMLNSVAQPVLREADEDGERERIRRVFLKMLRFSSFLSFPAMFGLAIVARELIVLSVTDKWLECVPVMQILCLWGAFAPIATLYAGLFNSLNHPNIYMWNTIALGLTQIGCVLLTYPFGLEPMLWVYAAVNVAWLLVWHFFAWRHIRLSLWQVALSVAPYALTAASVMAVTVLATAGIGNLWLSLAVKVLMAAAMYCLLMWLMRSTVFRESINYILKR